jgi:hypothetical protein
MESHTQEFTLGGHTVGLTVAAGHLFVPNAVTCLIADVVNINQGDVVFEIGSGVGPLAIYAALEPSSEVHAVEIVKDQYEFLVRNIAENGVQDKVHAYNGSFFDPIPDGLNANVIISDVSGIADDTARVSGWYPPKIPTGGSDGADNAVRVLELAGERLIDRLYFPIAVGLSNRDRILDAARSNFGTVEKRAEKKFPLPPASKNEILECLEKTPFYKDLEQRGSRHLWKVEIYEVTNPG